MTRGQAFLAAAFAAPALPAAAMSVALVFSFGNGPAALITFPLWYVIALVVEALLGGPLFLIAWRLRRVTWWTSALAGAVVGAAVVAIWSGLREPAAAAAPVALGAGAGLVFWLVARLGRDPPPAIP